MTPDLKGFADEILQVGFDALDIDGGDIQAIGIKYGLLIETEVTEPCGEFCGCAAFDFPATCFRKTYNCEAVTIQELPELPESLKDVHEVLRRGRKILDGG